MKIGDLISFKPVGFGKEDWSNPCIVLQEYEAPDEGLWVVWVDGVKAVIDNENYEITHLTFS
tara:strand:+ start:155 stop:340 length:186 start_codon:yes stop_codon:yes gene_type:complete